MEQFAQVLELVLSMVPAQYHIREIVSAVLGILVLLQVIVSQVVARLPVGLVDHPKYGRLVRALHRFSHARFKNEYGTLKAPLSDSIKPALISPTAVFANNEEAAESAYKAYAEAVGGLTYDGKPLPTFAEIKLLNEINPETSKVYQGWLAVAVRMQSGRPSLEAPAKV